MNFLPNERFRKIEQALALRDALSVQHRNAKDAAMELVADLRPGRYTCKDGGASISIMDKGFGPDWKLVAERLLDPETLAAVKADEAFCKPTRPYGMLCKKGS